MFRAYMQGFLAMFMCTHHLLVSIFPTFFWYSYIYLICYIDKNICLLKQASFLNTFFQFKQVVTTSLI